MIRKSKSNIKSSAKTKAKAKAKAKTRPRPIAAKHSQGTTAEDVPNTAVKFDSNKVRTHLFPVRAYLATCQVFDYGALKYEEGNWKRGESFLWTRLLSAGERHRRAFQLGENWDNETLASHLAHAICCDAMLLELVLTNKGIDDRGESQIMQGHEHTVVMPLKELINNTYMPPKKAE